MLKALKTKGFVGMLPQKIFKQLRSRTCYFLRLVFMELRAGTVGIRVPSLPIFLTFSTTQNLKRRWNGFQMALGAKRQELKTKQKRRVKSFLFLFCQTMVFRTYFVYNFIHSLINSKSNELRQSLCWLLFRPAIHPVSRGHTPAWPAIC